MKLIDLNHWYARVSGEIKIIETLESDYFPLDLGAVVITSKDGKRNFVIDIVRTDFTNPQDEGEILSFESKMEIDQETFEVGEEYNYELTVEDLKTATATLYYAFDEDCEEGMLDLENPIELDFTIYFEDDSEITIKLTNEVE